MKESLVDPKSSLSLLNEIKDIASKEAEDEKLKRAQSAPLIAPEATPAERRSQRNTTGSRKAMSSLNSALSAALADVHSTVNQKAEEEERERKSTRELAEQAKRAQELAARSQKAEEVAARIKAEEARQKAAEEERRIRLIKLEYEAALARGEQVEMPEELKPKPIPQEVLAQAQGPVEPVVHAPAPAKRNPLVLWGSLAATILVASLAGYFYMAEQERQRLEREAEARAVLEEQRRLREEEERRQALLEQQRLEREAREAKLKAELAAAIAAKEEAERQREEEAKKKKRRGGRKRPGKRKKPKIKGINLSGF